MPQFDASTYVGQLFWLIICFVVLNGAMVGWLVPRLRETLARRERKLQKNQREAEYLLSTVKALNHDIDKQLFNARQESMALIQHGIETLEHQQRAAIHERDQELHQRLISYEQDLDKRIEQVHEELKVEAVKLTDALYKKVFTGDDVKKPVLKQTVKESTHDSF